MNQTLSLCREEYHALRAQYIDVQRFTLLENVGVKNLTLQVPDAASFLSQAGDILYDQAYQFRTRMKHPVILDVGANIGLASLYFLSLYPDARVVCYEADPVIFDSLQRNLTENDAGHVEMRCCAVWNKNTRLSFLSNGADAGHVTGAGKASVEAIDFRDELARFDQIALLKIDIEGSENTVFPHISDQLDKVETLMLEYHSSPSEKQALSAHLNVIEKSGFRYHIHSVNKRRQPFIDTVSAGYFDCQLNVFCWRP